MLTKPITFHSPFPTLTNCPYYIKDSARYYASHPDMTRDEFDRMVEEEVNRKVKVHYIEELGYSNAPVFYVKFSRFDTLFTNLYKFYDAEIFWHNHWRML